MKADDAKSYVTRNKVKHSYKFRQQKYWERVLEEWDHPELSPELELPDHFNDTYTLFESLDAHLNTGKQRKGGVPGSDTLTMLTDMFAKGNGK